MIPSHLLTTALLILAGALGGGLAMQLHLPLPFMLGSLITTALMSSLLRARVPQGYSFPQRFRLIFIAAIGVMIGARVTSDLLAMIPTLALSFAAITAFVGLAHYGNYLIFRHLGGYDHATAYFCGTPGGLMESITMGEAAGADIATLTMQQFLRIVLVITLVPVGLSLWYGAPVGSAGGITLSHVSSFDLSHLPGVIATAAIGLALGIRLKLPAAQLTGPLFAAALVGSTGLATLDMPNWMINMAQVVIGASLGMRFSGLNRRRLARGLGLGLASVTMMLALAALFSAGLHRATGTPIDVLLISFAPGGVTEMGLIALSLHANAAVVTAHHIYRIILTVIEMSLMNRFRPFPPKQN